MTVTCSVSTVAASIAALTVSGVTIKGIDKIPDSGSLITPILFPQPNDYMTGTVMSFETYGSNGAAKMNMEYDLNYVFLYCQVGGVNAFAPFSPLISKLAEVLVTIMSNDAITGAVDMRLGSVGRIGVITDPAGIEYWGVMITLHVMEYAQ